MNNRTSINVENENEYDENCSVEYVNQESESEDYENNQSDYNVDSPLSPCYDNLLKEQHPFLQYQKIALENYLDPFFKVVYKAYSKDCFFDEKQYPQEFIDHIKFADFQTFSFSVLKKSASFFGTIKTQIYFQYQKDIDLKNCVLTLNNDQNEIVKTILYHILRFTKEIDSLNQPIFHLQKALEIIAHQEQTIKDEIYMQIVKQIQNNNTSYLIYYYQLMAVYATMFCPSKNYFKPLFNYFYQRKENNSLHQNYCNFILNRIYRNYTIKSDQLFLTEQDINKVMHMKPLMYEISFYHFAKFQMEMQVDVKCGDILNHIAEQLNLNHRHSLCLCLIKTNKRINEIYLDDDDYLFKIVKDHIQTYNKLTEIVNTPQPSFKLVIKLIKISSPYQNLEIFTLAYMIAIQDYLSDFFPLDEDEIELICSLKLAADYGPKRHFKAEQIDLNEYIPLFKKNTFDSNERLSKIIQLYHQQRVINSRDARYKILQILDQYPRFLGTTFKCSFKELSQMSSAPNSKIILNITFRGLICSLPSDQREYICHIDYDLIINFCKTNNRTLHIVTLDKQIYLTFLNHLECQQVYQFILKHESQISCNDFNYTNLS
ncbi:unnamed protein product (macronuclear) [Paramecium tetraurelia]|uniref:MyTH4 domain-containing protein n=1 Tax=Paramecium tetraurelia TaxID=5888 RepID=A0CSY1_PARTE|nr:uncharacterized protein GSPATT00010171001 [Paramecium tetraurelia]CAK73898.1 unnamed protein product [Paramecium tetraurelia]|eukprot:XP_001441295.1 hypothetical protein (macronuclear) [Paramecium tetraurelia strain d4-2]